MREETKTLIEIRKFCREQYQLQGWPDWKIAQRLGESENAEKNWWCDENCEGCK